MFFIADSPRIGTFVRVVVFWSTVYIHFFFYLTCSLIPAGSSAWWSSKYRTNHHLRNAYSFWQGWCETSLSDTSVCLLFSNCIFQLLYQLLARRVVEVVQKKILIALSVANLSMEDVRNIESSIRPFFESGFQRFVGAEMLHADDGRKRSGSVVKLCAG